MKATTLIESDKVLQRSDKGVTLGRKQLRFWKSGDRNLFVSKIYFEINDPGKSLNLGSCTNLLDSKMTYGLTLDWTVSAEDHGLGGRQVDVSLIGS